MIYDNPKGQGLLTFIRAIHNARQPSLIILRRGGKTYLGFTALSIRQ